MQNRRDFLKTSGTACAAIAGLGFLSTLESCKAPASVVASTYDAASNKISIPLSSFSTQNKLVVDGPNGDFKIFLMKNSETDITALQLKCTHRGHGVNMDETNLHCPLHGSDFDFSGNVTHGPATIPLKKYPVTVENDKAVILLA
ncbi:MAG: Rieske 2Fe-2S domain-containing protein [Bacteroidota bacterium]